ncbi:MAG: hypothetical protein H6625_07380 [Bdellovibrionaceae bacterium]|nr:hypothetical protein [Pseudobdellovibrionaceae bacterium]
MVACTPKKEVHNHYHDPQAKQDSPEAPTFEGVINGGGGKGALCKKNGQSSLEVLDLYEGRELYNLSYSLSPTTEEEMLELITEKMALHMRYPGQTNLSDMKKRLRADFIDPLYKEIQFTKKGQRLKRTTDANDPVVDSECQVVQIAVYYDESVLMVDRDYWDQLDWLHKGALLLHELVYYLARQTGEINSIQSRKMVGLLLSDQGLQSKTAGIPENPTEYLQCHGEVQGDQDGSDMLSFIAYNKKVADFNGTEIVFQSIGPQFRMFRTYAKLEGVRAEVFEVPNSSLGQGYSFMVFRDTYKPPVLKAVIDFSGGSDREFILHMMNAQTNARFNSYKVGCGRGRNWTPSEQEERGQDVTEQFLAKYSGHTYTEKDFGESVTVNSDGTLKFLKTRQVGSEDNPNVPYPTVCSYEIHAKLEKVIERSDAEKNSYMSYATHEIEYKTTDYVLVDTLEPDTTKRLACKNWLELQRASIMVHPDNNNYAELVSDSSFRLHTSGGGDFVEGGERTESTLDEVFVRQ